MFLAVRVKLTDKNSSRELFTSNKRYNEMFPKTVCITLIVSSKSNLTLRYIFSFNIRIKNDSSKQWQLIIPAVNFPSVNFPAVNFPAVNLPRDELSPW